MVVRCKVITIGNELLTGEVLNTNAAWISDKLIATGIETTEHLTISDKKEAIIHAIQHSFGTVELIITTGGLGPTSDDITKYTLAEFFNSRLVPNEKVLEDIRSLLKDRGIKDMNELNRKQAEVPENCTIIRNKHGTAPGMIFSTENCLIVSLPGVPAEMQDMTVNHVIPLVKKEFRLPVIIQKHIITQGISEANLSRKLASWESALPEEVILAFNPSPGMLKLRLSINKDNTKDANEILNHHIASLKKIITGYIVPEKNETPEQVIGNVLLSKQLTLAVAESCTGGYLSSLISGVPGSSGYFKGGITAYSNEIKQKILDVPPEVLERHGAVSAQTVKKMAEGVLRKYQTDTAIAISGIAGPTGGTEEKPVGTAWIAVGNPASILVKKFIFYKDRRINIIRASYMAINQLRLFIQQYY